LKVTSTLPERPTVALQGTMTAPCVNLWGSKQARNTKHDTYQVTLAQRAVLAVVFWVSSVNTKNIPGSI
jgi:hypothetical protein